MSDLFCKDCRHSRDSASGDPYRLVCVSPNNEVPHVATERYLVTGIPQPKVMAIRGASCLALRQKRDAATEALVCGPDAMWFEPKPKDRE